MHSDFAIESQWFVAMDSAEEHDFSFNESISFLVHCEDQEEVDYYWERLSSDKSAERCGWLKDKFGVSWQIVPRVLSEMLADHESEKSQQVMNAMLRMKKLDIQTLEETYSGPGERKEGTVVI